MEKKLYRSREHRVISGILGGLGEYFNIDPVILRLLYLLITIATGVIPGVIAYLVAIFIVPEVSVITPSQPGAEPVDDAPAI
jgi:phage shock protein C